MRPFLCAIDESVWGSVKIGWVRLDKPKAKWNKATIVVANANSKAINAISMVCLLTNFTRYYM